MTFQSNGLACFPSHAVNSVCNDVVFKYSENPHGLPLLKPNGPLLLCAGDAGSAHAIKAPPTGK